MSAKVKCISSKVSRISTGDGRCDVSYLEKMMQRV